MPTFNDVRAFLSGGISTEEDYAFPKAKEELAVNIRAEHLPKIRGRSLSIDEEGDIRVITEVGHLYISKDLFFLVASNPPVSNLGPSLADMACVLDETLKLRAPLRPTAYRLRVGVELRFTDTGLLERPELAELVNNLITAVEPHAEPAGLQGLEWRKKQREGEFTNDMEISAEPRQFSARYSRNGDPRAFSSFQQFAAAADVGAIADRLRPIVEPLLLDPSRILGRTFVR